VWSLKNKKTHAWACAFSIFYLTWIRVSEFGRWTTLTQSALIRKKIIWVSPALAGGARVSVQNHAPVRIPSW